MSGAERRTRPKSTDEQLSLTAASSVETSVPIEPASGRDEEEDEFETTDGVDARSTGSASATSSIYAHTYENGRRYQCFKNGRYPIPNDDSEQDREDMKHAMMLELTDGELFYAPIGDHPQSILDIGTGTGELGLPGLSQYGTQRLNVLNHVIKGIWAIDAGDRYPSARVRGIDLTPIQPTWVPPNVDFLIDDCEKDWLTEDCDLVHLRFMIIILRDVPTVLEHAFKSLRPGGWIEMQELCAEPLCDDNTMPDDDPVKYMYDLAGQAFGKFGMDVTLPKRLEPLLHDAGFRNIHVVVKKVPIGVWAKNKTLRLIGLYQKMAILDLMPALAGRAFSALGLSPEESQVTLAFARKGLDDYKTHRYFNYYFWYAQKPVS